VDKPKTRLIGHRPGRSLRRDSKECRVIRAVALVDARDDTWGLGVSPSSFLQDQLVEGEIRDRFAQPVILEVKLLQPFHLLDLQSAKHRSGRSRPRGSGPARPAHRPVSA
jgi:hypothetical protein